MKLNFIAFMVRNLENSVMFYQNLAGLQVVRRLNPAGGEIVFLANSEGETMLELGSFVHADKVVTKGMMISFFVEGNLEDLRKKALELGYAPSEIIDRSPKPKHFIVEDPDGIMVEFGS